MTQGGCDEPRSNTWKQNTGAIEEAQTAAGIQSKEFRTLVEARRDAVYMK